ITAHKAQGATLDRVIVDLAGCKGTEAPYVMCSRARSLDGLLVLRAFSPARIQSRQSEETRREMWRLHHLALRT
ncbi:hypothetical protein CALVIDRAFT_463614, partial [Calocera viscosa TUFC12733]